MSGETLSLEAALEIARAHSNVDVDQKSKYNVANSSKYAQKRKPKSEVNNGVITHTVYLDDAVSSLVYSGKVTYNDKGIVDTDVNKLSLSNNSYYPQSFEANTKVIHSLWLEEQELIGVVGKAPKWDVAPVNGILKYDGIYRKPFIGNQPTPSEERRSRNDIREIARINRYVDGVRKTSIMRASEINGVLPCWQTRTTFGEAEPFIEGTGQCTSCAFTVMGYNDSYCEDAVAKSQDRMLSSLNQKSQMFGDGESKFIERLRHELAAAWIQIESDIQSRYDDYLIEIRVQNVANTLMSIDIKEPMKFMKYKKSIIHEYAEQLAKVDEVETALDYAEYTLS